MGILLSALGYIYTHILPFVLLLGVLVFVHELGHFLVARYCGVRVEVFSLGFGKKILSYRRGDTLYCVSLIPLGGYVKMFGEQGSQAIETEADKAVSYSHKTVWQRIAIVAAGPLMNLFFAIFIFAFIYQTGEKTRAPVIADVEVNSPAMKMGLTAGDSILEANKSSVKSYEDFQRILNANKDSTIELLVREESGLEKKITATISSVENFNIFSLDTKIGQIDGVLPRTRNTKLAVAYDSPAYKLGLRTGDEIQAINGTKTTKFNQLEKMLLTAKESLTISLVRTVTTDEKSETPTKTEFSVVVDQKSLSKIKSLTDFGFDNPYLYLDYIKKDSPADKAGLQKHDRLISINSKKLTKWEDVADTIKLYDGKDAFTFVLERDGTQLVKKITPEVTEIDTAFGGVDKRFAIGIIHFADFAEPELTVVTAENPLQALAKGWQRSYEISAMTIMSFVKLFQGHVSVKNVGGMVSIGKAAKDSFETGTQTFLTTMGILSISLFILNLLPIPVLDGGHLVFYTIELIKGSPLSLRKMEIAQQVGLALLLMLMILAQYNDIVRLLFKT